MTPDHSARLFLGAGLLGALAVSCGDERNKAGPSPPVPTVAAVTIVGPTSVPPGGSAQFSAMVKLSDGTEKVATNARWFSSVTPRLTIDRDTGVARNPFPDLWGETVISVFLSLNAGGPETRFAREILVMPDGTFRMVGSVTDADSPGQAIPGAILEARLGEDPSSRKMAGTTAGTDGYRLYGVPPESYLHVRRPGYVPVTERVQIGSHTTRDFQLRSDANVPAFQGTYTMTVDATNCTGSFRFSVPLEPEYRLRTYIATITQSGARLTLGLSDARFAAGSDGFSGIATPSGADVQLTSSDYEVYPDPDHQPDVVELLADGTALETSGALDSRVILAGTPHHLSGTAFAIRRWRRPPTGVRSLSDLLGGCPQPRITLTRR